MKNKQSLIITILFVILTLFLAGFTAYAYFSANIIKSGNFNINITSKGADTLRFFLSNPIELKPTFQFNKDSGSNMVGTSTLDVTLNTTNEISSDYCYEVVFELPQEPVFVYTDSEPELVLDTYKEVNGEYQKVLSSLDITNKTGIIKVPNTLNTEDYKNLISTTRNNPKTDRWKAELTLVYKKNVDQSINMNKIYSIVFKANKVDC